MRAARLWDLLPAVAAIVLVATLGGAWAARLPYPYDLEWMEGAMLAEAWRLAHGMPLYTAPSGDWVPCLYPPGYPALLGALGLLVPISAGLGRAISVVATIAAALAIPYALGVRFGRDGAAVGALSAAVFLGTWHHVGTFYDLARIDALYVGFLAWAIAFGVDPRRGAWAASAAMLVCAFLVKQSAAFVGIPLLVLILARDGTATAARFAAAAALPALLTVGWLEWRTGGTFLDYAVRTPGAHPMKAFRGFPGTPWEVGLALPFAWLGLVAFGMRPLLGARWPVGLGIGAAAGLVTMVAPFDGWPLGFTPQRGLPDPGTFGSFVGVGALVAGAVTAGLVTVAAARARRWPGDGAVAMIGLGVTLTAVGIAMRAHHGGFLNVHAPVYWALAAGLGAVIAAARARGGAAWPGALLLTAQLGWSYAATDVDAELPTAKDRAIGDAIVATLRDVPEPVLSPFAAFLPVLAGHPPSWHLIALWDVDPKMHPRSPFPDARDQVRDALAAHRYGVIVDSEGRDGFAYDVGRWYDVGERLPGSRSEFVPKTGWQARPRRLLVPRQEP